MNGVDRLLRSVDRARQRSTWLGFPFAVMGKFGDDNGGAPATVVAYNAFFALFPLLLVVVTVLGFLLGRDSGFQQRVLDSAVAEFPIIGEQLQRNIHGLRGSGVGLVVGLVVFAVGLAASSLLTWLGSYGGRAVAVALANLATAAAVNVGLFLVAFWVLTPPLRLARRPAPRCRGAARRPRATRPPAIRPEAWAPPPVGAPSSAMACCLWVTPGRCRVCQLTAGNCWNNRTGGATGQVAPPASVAAGGGFMPGRLGG